MAKRKGLTDKGRVTKRYPYAWALFSAQTKSWVVMTSANTPPIERLGEGKSPHAAWAEAARTIQEKPAT